MAEALDLITLSNGLSFNFSEITKGTYVAYNGIRLTEIGKGYIRGEIDIRPELLNPNGILHGGVLSTLADTWRYSAVSISMRWRVFRQIPSPSLFSRPPKPEKFLRRLKCCRKENIPLSGKLR